MTEAKNCPAWKDSSMNKEISCRDMLSFSKRTQQETRYNNIDLNMIKADLSSESEQHFIRRKPKPVCLYTTKMFRLIMYCNSVKHRCN